MDERYLRLLSSTMSGQDAWDWYCILDACNPDKVDKLLTRLWIDAGRPARK